MRKLVNRIIFIICLLILITTVLPMGVSANNAVNDLPYNSYTYWETFDGTKKPVYCEDMYEPSLVIDAKTLGQRGIGSIGDICTDAAGNVYVLDSKNSIIYILDSGYKLQNVLNGIRRNEESIVFENAQGIYCRDNKLYICDTDGERVLVADTSGNLINEITVPVSPLIPENFKFRPIRVTVDSNQYIYILCEGSYYGALLCSDSGEFLSFYGANLIETGFVSTVKKLWRKLTMTNAKRSKSSSSIPFQFQDIYIDGKDFVYTATGSGVKSNQVKKLSPGGDNVLAESNYNYADVSQTYYITEETIINRNSEIANLAVDDDGYMYLLDTAYGRIFIYDTESRLLSAFGGGIGFGDKLGTFAAADAIELNGEDILVADKSKNSITVFRINEFGSKLKKARSMTVKGEYDKSYALWKDILDEDKNCQLAYIGLAKSEYSNENYGLALKYAKTGQERDVYSRAYRHLRDDFLRENFILIALGAIASVVLIVFLIAVLKKKHNAVLENQKLSTAGGLMFHPFESFRNVKYKDYGSVIIAAVIVIIFYLLKVCETNFGGFLFLNASESDSNALFLLLRTVGFVVLWTAANSLVSTLNGGLGKIKEIFIAVAYSLIPMIVYSILFLGLSNFLTSEEGGFLVILSVLSVGYTFILMLIGHMTIHDIGFGKAILSFIFTAVFMAIIVFLLFIMVVLVQQLAVFIYNIASELTNY